MAAAILRRSVSTLGFKKPDEGLSKMLEVVSRARGPGRMALRYVYRLRPVLRPVARDIRGVVLAPRGPGVRRRLGDPRVPGRARPEVGRCRSLFLCWSHPRLVPDRTRFSKVHSYPPTGNMDHVVRRRSRPRIHFVDE